MLDNDYDTTHLIYTGARPRDSTPRHIDGRSSLPMEEGALAVYSVNRLIWSRNGLRDFEREARFEEEHFARNEIYVLPRWCKRTNQLFTKSI